MVITGGVHGVLINNLECSSFSLGLYVVFPLCCMLNLLCLVSLAVATVHCQISIIN